MKVSLVGVTQSLGGTTPEGVMLYCARVSNPAQQNRSDTGLVNYLVRHNHWSPFEMVHMVVEIETTRDIARQILRHRSFSFQEFSQRYADVRELPPFEFRECRLQDHQNRQNSFDINPEAFNDAALAEFWRAAQGRIVEVVREIYGTALRRGIAKEVARAIMPEGMTPTRLYMAGTLRSFIHYIQVRCDVATQKEHRAVANEVRSLVTDVFPSLKETLNGNPS